jgi:trk system potassium uptake protein TrkA
MIAGGSHEAYYLAQLLHQHRAQAIMLVKERDRAQELAEKLDHALVLNGDATDLELLELEGVGGVSAFVALTDHDEINILSALLAKHAGAKQVVTLVNRMDYMPLARLIGLETVVSPRLSAANAILRYVRRGSVTSVATFKDSEAEAIAFAVSPSSPLVGLRLADIDFPEGAIVAAIIREAEVEAIVPRGDDKLQAGDQAVVFALPEAVGPVTELFPT